MSKITEIKQKQQDGSYKSFNISADAIVGLKNPDWNQNDNTAADYIKNRTHYIDGEEDVTLLNKTLTDWNESSNSSPSLYFNNTINLKAGDIVYIDFNNSGVKNEYILKEKNGIPYYGNLSLINGEEENTGEDFCIVFFPEEGDE